jgi:hypothetical protein
VIDCGSWLAADGPLSYSPGYHQSFALERWVAQNKCDPNYVVCKTPLGSIRITTSFAGEREARIVDPGKIVMIETHGCQAED